MSRPQRSRVRSFPGCADPQADSRRRDTPDRTARHCVGLRPRPGPNRGQSD
jgi:hypothetical protein